MPFNTEFVAPSSLFGMDGLRTLCHVMRRNLLERELLCPGRGFRTVVPCLLAADRLILLLRAGGRQVEAFICGGSASLSSSLCSSVWHGNLCEGTAVAGIALASIEFIAGKAAC